jgi:hypothetical protein
VSIEVEITEGEIPDSCSETNGTYVVTGLASHVWMTAVCRIPGFSADPLENKDPRQSGELLIGKLFNEIR